MKYRQREEIQADLKLHYGIDISTGKISDLERAFTVYLKALHEYCAPQIMAILCSGGYSLHIDATCETGRGTIFVAYCGSPEFVLGAWKIPTERADAILPKLRTIEALFGAPYSIMRDLGRAVTEAAIKLVGDRLIPIFACHLHFLKDIGKDLTEDAHDELRELFRRHKVRSNLASHARALGRTIGTDIGKAQAMVNEWLAGDRHQPLPAGAQGLAVVRSLAQWVLDYGADGTDAGFPFDQPMLDLYNRCLEALRVVESLLLHPSTDKAANRALERLRVILLPARSQIPFERPARTLKARAQLFQELRGVLRVEVKLKADGKKPDLQQQLAELRDAQTALAAFEEDLKQRRPKRGPGEDMRDAIDTILKHLKDHGPNLWGHLVSRRDGTKTLVARTNVLLERFFGLSKRGERRRSGRKNLTRDLEQMPAEGLLAMNLKNQAYLDIVCGGSIDNLAKTFAKLDAGNRSLSLPLRLKAMPAQDDADIVSSSLPKVDRDLVRTQAWRDRVRAEAKSRAPLRHDPGKGRRQLQADA